MRSKASPNAHQLQISRLAVRAIPLGAGAFIFGMQVWVATAFVCAAVLGEVVGLWRPLSRAYWTAILAAFSAQGTDIFITPYTWPLRFGFFFALIGTVVALWAANSD
jgi:hypothetical protein